MSELLFDELRRLAKEHDKEAGIYLDGILTHELDNTEFSFDSLGERVALGSGKFATVARVEHWLSGNYDIIKRVELITE